LGGAGSYTIGIAMGDATSQELQYFGIYDGDNGSGFGNTLLDSQSGVTTNVDNFMDIAGNVYGSGALWLAGQVTKTYSFTTGVLVLEIGASGGTENSALASLSIVSAGINTTVTPPIGSDVITGNSPTVTPGQNTVVTPFVARRSGLLVPERRVLIAPRKVFLPGRKAA
jgi:hypothetical protein